MITVKKFRLADPTGFVESHSANVNIYNFIMKNSPSNLLISVYMNERGSFNQWKCGNIKTDAVLTKEELRDFFINVDNEPLLYQDQTIDNELKTVGEMKIILTYIDGNTLEEEGVYNIELTNTDISYKYNRKKLGFIKYSGEIKLLIKDLKQITVVSKISTTLFHIENGIVEREHVMYDDTRKFNGRKYNR